MPALTRRIFMELEVVCPKVKDVGVSWGVFEIKKNV
jgi:hypothetical protein